MIYVTVAICTWNRCEQLKHTLNALCEIELPPDTKWEVIVVNNNCTDRTSETIRSFAGRLPIREAKEPAPGLSNARNRAIDSAAGDYIIYIDDDILVENGWLAEYVKAMKEFPDAAVFGGSIKPTFEGEPPAWLVATLPTIGGVFGMSQDLEGEIHAESPYLPLGGNMAIRRDVLRENRFDSRYGRTAGNLLTGEEAVLLRSILASAKGGRWVPAARVHHYVPKRMQTIEHVRRYFHDFGVSMMAPSPKRGTTLMGKPLWMWRQAVWHELAYRIGRVVFRPERWITDLKWASMAWGGLRSRPARIPQS